METKTIRLLYRINEQERNVSYVLIEDKKESWLSIKEEDICVISFDSILRDVIEFKENFYDYEKHFRRINDKLDLSKIEFDKELYQFSCNRLDSNNLITNYFSNKHYTLFCKEREITVRKITNFHLKKFYDNNRNALDAVHKALFEICNYDKDNNSTFCNVVSCEQVIIYNEHCIVFNVADPELENFFYNFKAAIHQLKLSPCNCKYCGNIFFGAEKSNYCNSESCKLKFEKEEINAKRRERDKSTYTHFITKLSNYIGQAKTKLPASVLYNPELVAEFGNQRKVYTKTMHEKLEGYKKANRLPDSELDQFYKLMRGEINQFCLSLKEKADKMNI